MTEAHRSWNMARIRGKDTKPEKIVRSLLHRLGFRFRLHVRRLPGTPDIVLPKYRTAVLVHGCFWHRHPGCRFAYVPKSNLVFWHAKFDASVERDRRNLQLLRQEGWHVIVIWECECADPDALSRRLSKAIRETGKSTPASG